MKMSSRRFHVTLISAGTTSAISFTFGLSAQTIARLELVTCFNVVALNLFGMAMVDSPLFSSPRQHFRQRLWLLPWVMALLFPASLLFRHTLLWVLSTLVLVGITFLCWRYRRANPETSLVLNLLSILAFTGGALLVSGTARDNALAIPLFMILSILPFTGLISLRPLLGLGITLTTVLIVSLQTSTRHLTSN